MDGGTILSQTWRTALIEALSDPVLAAATVCGLAAVGVAALAALVVMIRDHVRMEARLRAAEAGQERLQDEVWELRESADRYRSLVEGHGDLIVRRDPRGRLTYVNDAFAALAGRPADALLGTSFGHDPGLASTPGADGAESFDQAFETPGGTRWVAWVQTPVRGRDGAEIQAVGRDVTGRRRAESDLAEARRRAEAASEAKSRFLATMSHEIRTPLNGVLGMADLLAGTPLTAEQATYARAVKTSGQALLSILDEILDFSKIEAGRLDLAEEPVALAPLVEGVVELLAPRAQGKGIEIAGLVEPDVPGTVLGDGARLRQVLMNLAGNAVKFTEAGGVGVRVARVGDRLRIAVADTGPGIEPERLDRIFEEFEQADSSASSRHGGTGLGLAISRRLAERMGGSLTVTSARGTGSTFLVDLPLRPAGVAAGREADALAPLRGQRAVILSRSPYEAPFLAERLQAAHVAVVLSADVDEAVRLVGSADAPPAMLVVDGAMGEEAVRIVGAAAQEAGVPRRLVLLSPYERRMLGPPSAAGLDGYLVKPLRQAALAARLVGEPAPPPAGAGARPTRAVPALTGLEVLLAEDNDINALLASRLIERNGARVTRVRDGVAAVDRFAAACAGTAPLPDAILMDIRMPRLDGREATRRIRALERDHGLPRTRIVALTANVFEEDRRSALAAGVDAAVGKPVDEGTLVDALLARPPAALTA